MTSFTWGTVVEVNPLRVQLDGDTAALPFTPDTLIDTSGLSIDDRLRCELSSRRVVIIGRSRGLVPAPPVVAIGEHRFGEWTAATVPAGTVAADGSILNIADWPKLAAHYAAVYGAANHWGGNGTTTFAVPDTRERVYVNRGGVDVFATLGARTGTKTHEHPLSDAGQAKIVHNTNLVRSRFVSASGWTPNVQSNLTTVASSGTLTGGVGLNGSTDSGSAIQPSFVVRVAIQAA